jgi:hypothetical protein
VHALEKCDLQHTVTLCNTVQHSTTLCDTLQHSATPCNTLQHTCSLPNEYRRELGAHTSIIGKLTLDTELTGHDGCVNRLAWNSTGLSMYLYHVNMEFDWSLHSRNPTPQILNPKLIQLILAIRLTAYDGRVSHLACNSTGL